RRRHHRAAVGSRQQPGQRQRLLLEDAPLHGEMHTLALLEYARQLDPIPLQVDAALQLHVFLEVELPAAIPFEDCLLGIPYQREEFLKDPPPQAPLLQEMRIVLIEELSLLFVEEFRRQRFDPRRDQLDIDPYPAVRAHDGRGIVAAMGNGKMIFLARQKRRAGIGDPYLLHRKIRKKIRQQITACQMLPALEWMRYIPFKGNFFQEEGFGLFDKPNP